MLYEVITETPFYPQGARVLGHEFHYSVCVGADNPDLTYAMALRRGCGIGGGRDGLLYENTFAGYNVITSYSIHYTKLYDTIRPVPRARVTVSCPSAGMVSIVI